MILAHEILPGDRVVWGPDDTDTALRVETRESGLLDMLMLAQRGALYRLWIEKTCPVHVLDRPIDRTISIATLYRCARGALREARECRSRWYFGKLPGGWPVCLARVATCLNRVASHRARIAELRAS